MIVRSGETNPEALRRMGGSVLGHKWSPTNDIFTFQPKVYMGKKGRNSAYNVLHLLLENLDLNNSFGGLKLSPSPQSHLSLIPPASSLLTL